MATRNYTRPSSTATCSPAHLAELIRVNRGWGSAPKVWVSGATVGVDHASITPADDGAIQGVINGYAFDPNWGVNPVETAMQDFINTGTWSNVLNPVPVGTIVAFAGAVIPAGWALCDGQNGTPDLRDRFLLGATAAGPGVAGGTNSAQNAITHDAHSVTQPAGHSAHSVTQPSGHSNHAVTQPGNHAVTQPSSHSAHVVTQPAAHSNHVVTQPGNHATAGTGTTGTGLRFSAAGSAAHTGTAVDAHSAHSGVGVDAHSAHAGSAVDAHSGAAVDAHSAHSGTAVDAHSAHTGAAVGAHADHAALKHYRVAYIIKV